MQYVTEKYIYGGTSVMAYTDSMEPYAHCSVCLAEYGFVPPDDQIVVPKYDLTEAAAKKIVDDLADEVLGTITFGPWNAEGVLIRLKQEYRPKEKTYDEMLQELIMTGVSEEDAVAFLELGQVV